MKVKGKPGRKRKDEGDGEEATPKKRGRPAKKAKSEAVVEDGE